MNSYSLLRFLVLMLFILTPATSHSPCACSSLSVISGDNLTEFED